MKKFYLFAVMLLGTVVSADWCLAGTYITPGTSAAIAGAQSTLTSVVAVLSVDAGRSYSCSVVGSDSESNLKFTTSDSAQPTWQFCGAITPELSHGSGDDVADNRVCFISSTAGTKSFGVQSMKGSGEPARIECVETTLYGGYNTFVNPFNFLELLNISNAPIRVYVTAVNYDGHIVVDNLSYEIAANRRQDVDLHTPAGLSKYGLVKVTHNGPYGSLQAQVSQYNGTIESMYLTASTPVRPRDQNL